MVARLIAILAVFTAVAHAEGRPSYGGTVIATLPSEPASFDPIEARTQAEITVIGLLYDTLYRTTADGKVVPHLAAAMPDVSGKTARVKLRKGVTFSDGSALDASDVVASLQRLASSSDAGWVMAPVASVAQDGDDVVLTLNADAPDLAALLATPAAAITPKGAAPRKTPIGSGPFTVDTIDRAHKRIVLVANAAHFAGPPYLDKLELRWFDDRDAEARAFEDGKLELSARGATAFAGAQPKYKADVTEASATVLTFVGFSRAHAQVTGDDAFRKALDLAIARGGLTSSGSGERVTPTDDPIPADLGGPSLGSAAGGGNIDAALQALAGSKVSALAVDKRGDLSLEILVDQTRLDDQEVAEKIVRALDKLGIAAHITDLGAAELAAKVDKGEGDLWIGQLAAPGVAPAVLWGAAFAAGGDAWVEKQLAADTFNATTASSVFHDHRPILPLLHRGVRISHRSDVRGVGFDASSRVDFADLFLFGDPVKSKRKHG